MIRVVLVAMLLAGCSTLSRNMSDMTDTEICKALAPITCK